MAALIVLTAVPNLKEARQLSALLLKKKLAACVQISSPVESHYRWKGKNVKSREWQLWIKTRASLYSKVEKNLRENHSYDVPEILAIPVSKGNRSYLDWLQAETLA